MSLRKEIAAALFFFCVGDGVDVSAQPADVVIANANVITLQSGFPHARALAISAERIVGVYSDVIPDGVIGPRTRIIDAGERTIIPGLIDSHIHAIRAGLTFSGEVMFDGARSIDEAMQRVRTAAQRSGEKDWIIVAGGWTPQQFAEGRRPTLEELENAALGRRVYLQLFYRAVLLSEAGRAALHLDPRNLPEGLSYEHNENGVSSGWLIGSVDAIASFWEQLPKPDITAAKSGSRAFFSLLNSYGVTGVIDPGGHNLAMADYEAVFALARSNELTVRVDYHVSAPERGAELQFFRDYVRDHNMISWNAYLRFIGVGERATFGMYNNDNPSIADLEAFDQVARWALASRVPMTVHWNSERSVHHLLDAFARVGSARERSELRWSIAHLHDASPETMHAMHRLGLGWLTQNAFYFAAPTFIRNMPAARLAAAPPIGSALRAGLKVGAGTDATRVMTYNPFVALQWMLDGKTVDGKETRVASERPSREEALRLWTEGSAWFAFAENDRGRIAPGMLADLAILSADYMSVPVEQIGAIRSILTMVGGRVVHESP